MPPDPESTWIYRVTMYCAAIGCLFFVATDFLQQDEPGREPPAVVELETLEGYIEHEVRPGCTDGKFLRAAGHPQECYHRNANGSWQYTRAY